MDFMFFFHWFHTLNVNTDDYIAILPVKF